MDDDSSGLAIIVSPLLYSDEDIPHTADMIESSQMFLAWVGFDEENEKKSAGYLSLESD